jgi:hypothetical protein
VCNLECIGDGGALVFLGIRTVLLNGLEKEDRSGIPAYFSGEVRGDEAPIKSVDRIDGADHARCPCAGAAVAEKSA